MAEWQRGTSVKKLLNMQLSIMKSHHAMVSKIRCLPACRPAGKDERLAMAGRLLVPSTMSWAEEWHKAGG